MLELTALLLPYTEIIHHAVYFVKLSQMLQTPANKVSFN